MTTLREWFCAVVHGPDDLLAGAHKFAVAAFDLTDNRDVVVLLGEIETAPPRGRDYGQSKRTSATTSPADQYSRSRLRLFACSFSCS